MQENVAIITGGTGDLGRGICRALKKAGATTVALDLEPSRRQRRPGHRVRRARRRRLRGGCARCGRRVRWCAHVGELGAAVEPRRDHGHRRRRGPARVRVGPVRDVPDDAAVLPPHEGARWRLDHQPGVGVGHPGRGAGRGGVRGCEGSHPRHHQARRGRVGPRQHPGQRHLSHRHRQPEAVARVGGRQHPAAAAWAIRSTSEGSSSSSPDRQARSSPVARCTSTAAPARSADGLSAEGKQLTQSRP